MFCVDNKDRYFKASVLFWDLRSLSMKMKTLNWGERKPLCHWYSIEEQRVLQTKTYLLLNFLFVKMCMISWFTKHVFPQMTSSYIIHHECLCPVFVSFARWILMSVPDVITPVTFLCILLKCLQYPLSLFASLKKTKTQSLRQNVYRNPRDLDHCSRRLPWWFTALKNIHLTKTVFYYSTTCGSNINVRRTAAITLR